MMQRVVNLLLVLVLILQEAPVLPKPLILTQENFDLDRFMGKWYEIAVISTCPHYMQRKRASASIITLELQHVASEGNFTMTTSSFRNGSCTQTSTIYSLTDTPGRFFHHVARFGADMDSFVVCSSYDEYAMILQLGTEKPSGNKTTTVRLYSRTVSVGTAVLDDFKTLVRQHGLSDDAIIMNQNKGECVPGEQVPQPVTARPQIFVAKRCKTNLTPSVVSAQKEDPNDFLWPQHE